MKLMKLYNVYNIIIKIYQKYIKTQEHFENDNHNGNEIEKKIMRLVPLDDIPTINVIDTHKSSGGIPFNIFTCWDPNPLLPKMSESIKLVKDAHPTFQLYIYDNNDCYNFIKKYFNDDVLNAYTSLIPEAYKADLWRYCVIYVYGGIYQDIKYQPFNGFSYGTLLNDNDSFFTIDTDYGRNGIYNAFFGCAPRNPKLALCINKIVENVKSKFYGENPLYPTGPLLMKQFFSDKEREEMDLYKTDDFVKDKIASKKNGIVLKMYDEYRTEQKNQDGFKSYDTHWHEKNIYK